MILPTIAMACIFVGPLADDEFGADLFGPTKRAPAAAIDFDFGPQDNRGSSPPPRDPPREMPRQAAPINPLDRTPPASEQRPRTPVAPIKQSRVTPPDLVDDSQRNIGKGTVSGQAITLSQSLEKSNDRAMQLKITQAYWKLSAAQSVYYWTLDDHSRLAEWTEDHTKMAETLSAKASSRANILEAELALVKAQHDLAELLGMRNAPKLPLAADHPHVGDYNTRYESYFSGNNVAPPRMQLIHRSLPVRHKAIEEHGQAIVLSLDAAEDLARAFNQNPAILPVLLVAMDQLRHERRAFIANVREYNIEFAEYLLFVAPANTPREKLAEGLILKSDQNRTASTDGRRINHVEPGSPNPRPREVEEDSSDDFDFNGPREEPKRLAPRQEPAPAAPRQAPQQTAPRNDNRSGGKSDDFPDALDFAPPAATKSPFDFNQPSDEPAAEAPRRAEPAGRGMPVQRETPTPARETPTPAKGGLDSDSNGVRFDAFPHRMERVAGYAPAAILEDGSGNGIYSALVSAKPAVATQKLSGLLHWDRVQPPGNNRAVSLADCLRNVPPKNRPSVISDYWQAREMAARYQATEDQLEQLNNLAALISRRHGQAGMAEAGVRLQAVRVAALAAKHDAHRELLQAQFELMRSSNARFDAAWLLPSTTPQAGGYDLGTIVARDPYSSKRVKLQYSAMNERASALIRIDTDRVEMAKRASAANQPAAFDHALWAVLRQHQETMEFLSDVTVYNLAIADFALEVSPPGISSDELIKALVVVKSSRG